MAEQRGHRSTGKCFTRYWLFEFISISLKASCESPAQYGTAFLRQTETDENDLTYFIINSSNYPACFKGATRPCRTQRSETRACLNALQNTPLNNNRHKALISCTPDTRISLKQHCRTWNATSMTYATARATCRSGAKLKLLEHRKEGAHCALLLRKI